MNAAYAPGLSSVPGVPASASASAAHSLGEAYGVAAQLGGPVGVALRRAARDSFVHGLHVTLLVSAGLLLLGAVMALRLPRIMQCGEAAAPVELPSPREVADSRVSA
jgi:MFS transporter, DHA2 family, multidrug resistance protein